MKKHKENQEKYKKKEDDIYIKENIEKKKPKPKQVITVK